MTRRAFALLALLASLASSGCSWFEKAAAKDPLKCERDPNCQKRDRMNDCTAQCVDDPACMDRCRQFQQGTTGAGR